MARSWRMAELRYLGLIQKNAERMGSLIDDLLAFSRLNRQPLTRSLVSPAALVRETFDSLEAERNGREIELVVGDLPPCQADYSLLRQVFVNLLSNAVKFTRNRTPTRIEVGSRRRTEAKPSISSATTASASTCNMSINCSTSFNDCTASKTTRERA